MDILAALGELDSMEDDHWTNDGAPMVTVVKEILGENITRQEIIDVAPNFSRENMELPTQETPDQETAADETSDQEITDETSDDETASDETSDEVNYSEIFIVRSPMRDNEFLRFLKSVPEDQLETVRTTIHEHQLMLRKAEKKMTEHLACVDLACMYVDDHFKTVFPDMTDAEANQAYIASQNKQREERVLLPLVS